RESTWICLQASERLHVPRLVFRLGTLGAAGKVTIFTGTGHVRTEPTVRLSGGGAPSKVDGLAHVLQATKASIRVCCLQHVCTSKTATHPICVQHHVADLHSGTFLSTVHLLVEALELEVTLAVGQRLACDPASAGI
ncbi:hypothetical protein AALO_G00294290, partial [Alosa alosa]